MAGLDRRTALQLGSGAVLVAAVAFGVSILTGDPERSSTGARPEFVESTDGERRAAAPPREAVGASAEASRPWRIDPPAARATGLEDAIEEDGIGAGRFDEGARPSRAFMRHAFESAVAESFPDRRLSSDEIERVTDSLMTLRDAKQALLELPLDEEHAEQRRLLIERIGEASSVFRDVMDITPSEFTSGAEPGIDRHDADEVIPEPEFLEPER